MDLNYLYKALMRKKWLIILSVFMGAAAGIAFTFVQKKSYLSTAQYSTGLTQTQKVSLSLTEIMDINQIDSKFSNIIETFKSPNVLGMLSYETLLHDLESQRPFRTLTAKQKNDTAYRYANIENVKKILRDKLSNMSLLTTYDPEEKKVWDLLSLYEYDEFTLSKKLLIERIPHTDFLSVSFSSEKPELSAFIVNTIGVKFKEFYNFLTTTRAKESLTKLDSLSSVKRKQVDSLKARYEKFRTQIGTPNIGDAATAAMSGVQELTTNLTTEESKLNTLNSQLNSVVEQLATINTTPVTATHTENYNDEIVALREKNRQLSAQLTEKGGVDPDIEAKIKANNNKLLQLSNSTVATPTNPGLKIQERREQLQNTKLQLEADIEASKRNVALYKSRVDEFSRIAHSGGGNEAIASTYLSDLNNAQKELDKYNNSLFASQDIDVSPDMIFKQTLQGQPAIMPETRHRTITVLLSAVAMFFMTIFLIIILEFLDNSLRTPFIFAKETKLKLLTAVNRIDLQKKQLKEYFELAEDVEREAPTNTFIENLRKLRFELENCGKKIILITSLKPKEGKSTILEALANTFSMSKKKILIIDSNFSDNSLTRTFNAKPTLETFSLNSQDNAIDKIWGVTSLTNISNTDIIGCNEGNYTPSEILPKNNLFLNIHKIAQHYDFILIEGAALNNHSDCKELSKMVEGIVAVFSSKNSLNELDKESINFLKNNTGNKFIGAVLNNVSEDFLEN
jgi:polysaccharide biosynthesis transport protein